jgi:hypothetical protein
MSQVIVPENCPCPKRVKFSNFVAPSGVVSPCDEKIYVCVYHYVRDIDNTANFYAQVLYAICADGSLAWKRIYTSTNWQNDDGSTYYVVEPDSMTSYNDVGIFTTGNSSHIYLAEDHIIGGEATVSNGYFRYQQALPMGNFGSLFYNNTLDINKRLICIGPYTTDNQDNIIIGATEGDDRIQTLLGCELGGVYSFRKNLSINFTALPLSWCESWSSGPVTDNTQIYIGSDGISVIPSGVFTYGILKGRLLAFGQGGNLIWSKDINDCAETDVYPAVRGLRTYPVWSSPVIDANNNIYIAGRNKLYAYTPTGSLLWDYTIGENSLWAATDTASIDDNGIIYIGGATTNVYAASDSSLLFNEFSPSKFTALTPQGSTKWVYDAQSGIFGSGIGSDGSIYVQEFGGDYNNPAKLLKLNPDDGKVIWEYVFDVFFQDYSDIWQSLYLPREKSSIMSNAVAIEGGQWYFTKDHCRRTKL